eukprot:1208678-Rhodomonas_salina.1
MHGCVCFIAQAYHVLCTHFGGSYRLDAHIDAHDAVRQRDLVRPLDRRAVRHGIRKRDAHLDDLPSPTPFPEKSRAITRSSSEHLSMLFTF